MTVEGVAERRVKGAFMSERSSSLPVAVMTVATDAWSAAAVVMVAAAAAGVTTAQGGRVENATSERGLRGGKNAAKVVPVVVVDVVGVTRVRPAAGRDRGARAAGRGNGARVTENGP